MHSTHLNPMGSGVRRRAAKQQTPTLSHLTPHDFVEPIRSVKRASVHWKRKVFHVVGIGTAGFTYALTSVDPLTAAMLLGSIGALFVFLDALRFWVPSLNKMVKRDFGPFMRDYELDGLSGSSWFFFAGVLSILLFPKTAAALGMVFLAVGDPIASLVGVKWGRIKLPGGKSLEGSLALAALCTVVGVALLAGVQAMPLQTAVPMAVLTALAAAVAEWLPVKKLDDNFVMPLLTGGVATILLGVLA